MNNLELCHYGVKGMRWGVQRHSKKQFKRDVRYARKHGLEGDYEYDPGTGELKVTQWYNSKRQKISEAYAKKVLSEATGRMSYKQTPITSAAKKGKSMVDDFMHTTGRRVTLDMVDEKTGRKMRTVTALESKYTEDELTRMEKENSRNGNYRTIDVTNYRRK